MEKGTGLVIHRRLGNLSFTLCDTLGDPSLFKQYKDGEVFFISIIKPPSSARAAMQRKFFAILDVVYENQEVWATLDTLRDAILCAIGFRDEIEAMIQVNGKMVKGITYRAKSISYEKCSDREFLQVYQKAEKFICERILSVAPEELEAQVIKIIEGRKK